MAPWAQGANSWTPLFYVLVFIVASILMIWRLEAMSRDGVEGTVLGTLVMPYCSGMGNLVFAFVLGAKGGKGEDVVINSLVNNITNMTLLIGLPALIWGMNVSGKSGRKRSKEEGKAREIDRLSLLLSLTAVLFFSGAVWALARDGHLNLGDALVLVGLFLFWQAFHVFDVLKHNIRNSRSFGWRLPFNLLLVGIGGYFLYVSTDWLVGWLSSIKTGFISAKHLGWLSGWLMVLPNGILAVYYARRGNPEIVYTSQVGDGHICIPLCIGIFSLYRTAVMPAVFHLGMQILCGVAILHFVFVALFGRLPRWAGAMLIGCYALFLYKGLLSK